MLIRGERVRWKGSSPKGGLCGVFRAARRLFRRCICRGKLDDVFVLLNFPSRSRLHDHVDRRQSAIMASGDRGGAPGPGTAANILYGACRNLYTWRVSHKITPV